MARPNRRHSLSSVADSGARKPDPGFVKALALALAVAFGCGGPPEDRETRVRAVLAELEAAGRARDVDALLEPISDQYRDSSGADERALRQLAVAHFLRNRSVYTLTRIRALEFPEPTRASVAALVALAAQPLPESGDPRELRADLYRFALELVEEEPGVWRIRSASWHTAQWADFASP